MRRSVASLSTSLALLVVSVALAEEGATVVWFEPGDRLIADVGPSGELIASLMSNGAPGETLVLDFLPSAEEASVGMVLTEGGTFLPPPATFVIEAKHGPTKAFRRKVKMPTHAPYVVAIGYDAPPGTYVVRTGLKVPKKFEGTKKKKLKPTGPSLTAAHAIPALAGSTLDLRLDAKKGFTGTLSWTLRDEGGAVVASGNAAGGTPGAPDVDELAIPLVDGGTYSLVVSGFTKGKQRVKLVRTLHPGALLGEDVPICP
ncbi:MAG: hypothetical protein ACF8XB_14260 [Planctomycetota bacterium JB042]